MNLFWYENTRPWYWTFQPWSYIRMSLMMRDQHIHCQKIFWKCQGMKQFVSIVALAISFTMKSSCWKIDLKLQKRNLTNIVDWRKEKRSWNSSCSWQQALCQWLRKGMQWYDTVRYTINIYCLLKCLIYCTASELKINIYKTETKPQKLAVCTYCSEIKCSFYINSFRHIVNCNSLLLPCYFCFILCILFLVIFPKFCRWYLVMVKYVMFNIFCRSAIHYVTVWVWIKK